MFFNFVNENDIMEEFVRTQELEIESLRDQLLLKDEVIAQGIAREQELSERINVLKESISFVTAIMKQSFNYLLNR